MESKVHDGSHSNAIGLKGEQILDAYFSKFYTIEEVTMNEQFQGIDRFFHKGDIKLAFEYKCDTYTSGNVFVETLSNIESGRLGWAFTSKADYIVYFFLNYDFFLLVKPADVKNALKDWVKCCRYRDVYNKVEGREWHSRGRLVTIEQFIADTKAVKFKGIL